jgi:predicted nucleotidyltransferase
LAGIAAKGDPIVPVASWDTAPEPVRSQIKRFVRDSRAILGDNLVGIYLHGSLAMGCFNPERSDIDLLVVTHRSMSPETKRLTAGLMLAQSGAPRPLEVSWVLESELKHWRQPFPYDLHFSEGWRKRFEANLNRLDWEMWGSDAKFDPDLAAHFTILLRRGGVVLFGPPVPQIFPVVPTSDYIDALLFDFEEARDEIVKNPVYGVLNLLRVFWYLRDGQISSKEEAGRWGAKVLPDQELRALAAAAVAVQTGADPTGDFPADALTRFARYVDMEVDRLLVNRHLPADAAGKDPVLECLRCHMPLEFAGMKHMQEGIPLRMFFCPSCGKAEFYVQRTAQ